MSEPLFIGRRYSAIMVRDPRLTSLNDIESRMPGCLDARSTLPAAASSSSPEDAAASWSLPEDGEWSLVRTRLLLDYGLSNSDAIRGRQVLPSGQFGHSVYFAKRASGTPIAILASPYIGVLNSIVQAFDLADEPKLVFLRPRMSDLFDSLREDRTLLARQVVVQVDGNNDVETVALTGANPLNSKIHAGIGRFARPYGVRLGVTRGNKSVGVTLDKFGNFGWPLSREERLESVLQVFDGLVGRSVFEETHTVPTRRLSSDE